MSNIYSERQVLHNSLEDGDMLKMIRGKYKGKKVKLLKKYDTQDYSYGNVYQSYCYHNYFSVRVETLEGYKFITSCKNIEKIK